MSDFITEQYFIYFNKMPKENKNFDKKLFNNLNSLIKVLNKTDYFEIDDLSYISYLSSDLNISSMSFCGALTQEVPIMVPAGTVGLVVTGKLGLNIWDILPKSYGCVPLNLVPNLQKSNQSILSLSSKWKEVKEVFHVRA